MATDEHGSRAASDTLFAPASIASSVLKVSGELADMQLVLPVGGQVHFHVSTVSTPRPCRSTFALPLTQPCQALDGAPARLRSLLYNKLSHRYAPCAGLWQCAYSTSSRTAMTKQ